MQRPPCSSYRIFIGNGPADFTYTNILLLMRANMLLLVATVSAAGTAAMATTRSTAGAHIGAFR